MLTGLWNLKDIQNSRQNRSKNKLVRENAVTKRREVALSALWAPGERDHIKIRDYMDRGVPHQSGLPNLPGVPHLHVNRPWERRWN